SSRDVDIRADIYSLGCTFYFLLAGQAPFPSTKYSTLMQQMWAHSQAPLPPIRELRPDLPEDLAGILARMLAKNRDDRFARPEEVPAALAPSPKDCHRAEHARSPRRPTTSRMDLSHVSTGRPAGSKTAALPPGGPLPWRTLVLGVALLLAVPLA